MKRNGCIYKDGNSVKMFLFFASLVNWVDSKKKEVLLKSIQKELELEESKQNILKGVYPCKNDGNLSCASILFNVTVTKC